MQPIVTLTCSFDEAKELYRALVQRYFVEDALRQERGLEPIAIPALAERLEHTLGVSQDEALQEAMRSEDALWEHAWLSFTDEWAWHRAKQDVLTTIGKKGTHTFTHDELDTMTEKIYETRFETYQKEVALPGHEHGGSCEWPSSTKEKNTTKLMSKKGSRNK